MLLRIAFLTLWAATTISSLNSFYLHKQLITTSSYSLIVNILSTTCKTCNYKRESVLYCYYSEMQSLLHNFRQFWRVGTFLTFTKYLYGGGKLTTEMLLHRCPVDDKLISRFRGSWSETGVYETQVFAYMKTFRFTGSPALYIECDVRMCHGRCPVSIYFNSLPK